MQEACRKYQMEIEDIDLIPVKFDDIDVSARTDRGIITLNWKLLKETNFTHILGYLCHELVHHLDQLQAPTQSADEGDYLANPSEQKAFQSQIEFLDNHLGKEEANRYTNQVLDHHQEKGEERKEKKEILMQKVED